MGQLIQLLEKILRNHSEYLALLKATGRSSQEEETLSQHRRIMIKSLLVILNFVYSKKYIKDVISGFS